MKTKLFLVLFLCVKSMFLFAQEDSAIIRHNIGLLDQEIPGLMKAANIPGSSVAWIHGGKIVWIKNFGVVNSQTQRPVTQKTLFEGASLSKPVFAIAVLKLVDEGKFNLDTPLNSYFKDFINLGNDPRVNRITARTILCHTSGIPNHISSATEVIRLVSTPGEKYTYSPLAFFYLSKVIEKITGMKVADYIGSTVLKPAGMTSSSFVWLADSLRAYGHTWNGSLVTNRWEKVGYVFAGGSLQTTAGDYARLLTIVMNRQILKKKTWDEMLKPQISPNSAFQDISWGLGWGLETGKRGESFWHWGDATFAKAFAMASLPQKEGLVFFANGENGLSFISVLIDRTIGINTSVPGYLGALGYQPYDSPALTLLNTANIKGAIVALLAYHQQLKADPAKKINEAQMNDIGYKLLNVEKAADAVEILKQNTIDYPDSYNAFDSLGEAYRKTGNKELAILNYKRSVELNPNNESGKQALLELQKKL